MRAKVKFNRTVHNCFLALPRHLLHPLSRAIENGNNTSVVLELSWEAPIHDDISSNDINNNNNDNIKYNNNHQIETETRRTFVSWHGAYTAKDVDALEISWDFADCIGMTNSIQSGTGNFTVNISILDYVSRAATIEVEPLTADDWELIELHAIYLENELLRQVSVVYLGEIVPLWIHGNKLVRLKVIDIEEKENDSIVCKRLTTDTEVCVSPKQRQSDKRDDSEYEQSPVLRVQPHILHHKKRIPSSCTHQSCPLAVYIHPATSWDLDGTKPILPSSGNICMCAHSRKGQWATLWFQDFKKMRNDSKDVRNRIEEGKQELNQTPSKIIVCIFQCRNILPGHIFLPWSTRQKIGAKFLSTVRIQILSHSHIPVAIPQIIAYPVIWSNNNSGPSRLWENEVGVDSTNEGDAMGEHPQNAIITSDTFRGGLLNWYLNAKKYIGDKIPLSDGLLITLDLPLKGSPNSLSSSFTLDDNNNNNNNHSDKHNDKDKNKDKDVNIKTIKVNFVLGITSLQKPGNMQSSGNTDNSINNEVAAKMMLRYIIFGPKSQSLAIAQKIQLGADIPLRVLNDTFDQGPYTSHLGGISEQLESSYQHILPIVSRSVAAQRLTFGVARSGGLLIYGDTGCGRTSFCRGLCHSLRTNQRSFVNTVWIDCRDLAGTRMRTLLDTLTDAFTQARHFAPSIIVLDDLDTIVPAESEDAPDANIQSVQISDHLFQLMRKQTLIDKNIEYLATDILERKKKLANKEIIQNAKLAVEALAVSSSVAVVATCRDPNVICKSMRKAGMFDTHIEVSPPNTKARAEIMQRILERIGESSLDATATTTDDNIKKYSNDDEHNSSGEIEFGLIAELTEGCRPNDLETIISRAVHQSVLRTLHNADYCHDNGKEEKRRVTQEDLLYALKEFTPSSLRNAQLFTSNICWKDIGGLLDVKKELRDILETPSKYAKLYSTVPIRLPQGILLYGPPGCGKTLVAGAVAKECGLHFISVKGPEVLDKYIGASEQAIRNLFARAASAAPCVLFFDEFEAIAPRRGSDNTGVTDRVVNQLLTFLDGVEGRSGVYVMGATSRPDLIDPALLRPGRLDRQLYCGFPTAEERFDILKALSRKLSLAEGCEDTLKNIAFSDSSESFTGADCQGVLSTAQLNAVHEVLEKIAVANKKKKKTNDNGKKAIDAKKKNDASIMKSNGNGHHVGDAAKIIDEEINMLDAYNSPRSELEFDEEEEDIYDDDDLYPDNEENIDSESDSNEELQITSANLLRAFGSTRPSIPHQEFIRYNTIYDKFKDSRKAQFSPANATNDVGQPRTSLK